MFSRRLVKRGFYNKNVLMRFAKIPSYLFDAGLADPRAWPEADIRRGIEGFVEVMESHKKVCPEAGMPVAHPV